MLYAKDIKKIKKKVQKITKRNNKIWHLAHTQTTQRKISKNP
jgi:hypothetical protein